MKKSYNTKEINIEVQLKAAEKLWSTGDHAEAFTLLSKLGAAAGNRDPRPLFLHARLAMKSQEWGEAAKALDSAIRRFPRLPGPRYERAVLLIRDKAFVKAERLLKQEAALGTSTAAWFNSLARALIGQQRFFEAIDTLREATALYPDEVALWMSLGRAHSDVGEVAEARTAFAQAARDGVRGAVARSSLLHTLNFDPSISDRELFEAHCDWGRDGSWAASSVRRRQVGDISGRKIRIGYVSSDFRKHSVAYFFLPLLEHHDRSRFEIFCYSNTGQDDETTARIRALSDGWRPIVGRPSDPVVKQIDEDEIDVLVDLNGHSGQSRFDAFALSDAPVKATWLGYPNTTGLSQMDFRIVDETTDPAGEADALATERLWRLGRCFLAYQPPHDAPPVVAARDRGRPLAFGSFNNIAKVNDDVLACWGEILQRVPDSVLILKGRGLSQQRSRDRILDVLSRQGISKDRLIAFDRIDETRSHLDLYNQVDIALDPFPYNGTTTTCEALWMGVPVITLEGTRHAGRVGASILRTLGMPELVAGSRKGYIDLAVEFSRNVMAHRASRHEIRERFRETELFDGADFARHMESAYLGMLDAMRAR